MADLAELYDVTIIGGGPVGMYAAFYSGMRNLRTKLIERERQLGGQILFYLEKTVWDVGGIARISGEQLLRQLVEQANVFHPTIVLGQRVESLERCEDGTFTLSGDNGERHRTRAIVLAAGRGIADSWELDVQDAERYARGNLRYRVDNLDDFRDKRVLISGGGNSAVDWAIELESVARQVTIVHRRDRFGGFEQNVARMKASSIEIVTPYKISKLHGDGHRIAEVELTHMLTGEPRRLETDEVLVHHGIRNDLGAIRDWGIRMEKSDAFHGSVVVNAQRQTNIPGIFAAGDLANYPNKSETLASGFADGLAAINGAALFLHPEADLKAIVSSEHETLAAKTLPTDNR